MQVSFDTIARIGESSHVVTDLLLLGYIGKQYKIWTRLKERVNTMWFLHCKDTGDPYSPLENGLK